MEVTKKLKQMMSMFTSSPKVLVTGGTGYIGSHTVVALLEAGYDVYVVDNLSNSNIEVLNGIEQITGKRPIFENIDCTDYVAMDKFFTKHEGIKAVIHFAASKAVGESVEMPLKYYRNNVVSLVNLLELMPIHKVEGLVFSSSCTVYGQPDVLPVDEKAPIKKALSPYGNTKQICEDIIMDTVHANHALKSILLRYFNTIGAPPSAAIRDYINVMDLAYAHVTAVDRLLNKDLQEPEVYNLGTGKGLSVMELIKTFEAVNGVKVPYEIVGRR